QILDGKARVASLESDIQSIEESNESKNREIEELQEPQGIERAARERYGMVDPGEEVYIVPEHMKGESGGG
ncbi:MAG: septum formation initiator family protein, partial [Rubrobacter sp.]|nr:septum formation initiator family protein [Rubrobacter sp.]